MTALAKLPEKWQATAEAIAKPYGFVTEHTLGKAEALSNCADELTAALSPAELGGVEWGSHRDQLAELLLIDPESGKRCFIVSPLRSGPGGFQSFDIQSGPNAPKWCIEVRTSESGVTVPPASGCDREGQHVGACLDTSVELPRQVNPADAPSIACQLCWGDLWMKDGTPCPSCNRTGRRGHAHSTPRAAEAVTEKGAGNHGLDTDEMVRFYERDFYVLSNFSSFRLNWRGIDFDTSEAAYHWEKFDGTAPEVQDMIREARSAHDAFKLAESQKVFRREDWDSVKLDVMHRILRAKADQHEYVRRKLLATGDRLLVEDSWRDDFWGWGPNRDGQNWLGRLWMEVRAALTPPSAKGE